MKPTRILAPLIAASALGLFAMPPAQAENWSLFKDYSFNKLQLAKPKAFAKHFVVMQVSQGDPQRWKLVLNNVANMTKFFGPDNVQVVVVAYGPGLKMLLKNSKVGGRIQGLSAQGVEFDACHNTMEGMKRKIGHLPKLVNSAVVIPGGVVRIIQLEQHGYTYIKP